MRYSTDLSDDQWDIVKHLFERRTLIGAHLARHSKRELVNAVMYINKTGCQWRMLPKDFPPHSAVSSFYYRTLAEGTWEKLNELLVELSRVMMGRNEKPSYCLIDSQSVKTTGNADERGFDGGKK